MGKVQDGEGTIAAFWRYSGRSIMRLNALPGVSLCDLTAGTGIFLYFFLFRVSVASRVHFVDHSCAHALPGVSLCDLTVFTGILLYFLFLFRVGVASSLHIVDHSCALQ